MNIVSKCIYHILQKLWRSKTPDNIVRKQTVLAICFSFKQFTIVPILVGSLSPEKEACYGRILSRYLADPQNLFVISSDFCHWGHRFRYTYYDRSYGNIYQSIEGLDRVVSAFITTSCT